MLGQRIAVGLTAAFLWATHTPVFAQDDESPPAVEEQEAEQDSGGEGETGGQTTWRPSGSLFDDSTPTRQQRSTEAFGGRPLPSSADAPGDPRAPVLVFDLYYEHGVTFSEGYLSQFEEAFWGALESDSHRALSPRERMRLLRQHTQLITNEVSDARACEVAAATGVALYLVPRVEIEDRRTLRISMTTGDSSRGCDQPRQHSATSDRVVEHVEARLTELATEAFSELAGARE